MKNNISLFVNAIMGIKLIYCVLHSLVDKLLISDYCNCVLSECRCYDRDVTLLLGDVSISIIRNIYIH